MPGVMAQDITTWGEMKQVYRELKKPEVKATFKAVVIDTIDIAADLCTKYVCQQNDIDSLSELPYGKGWTLFKEEFNDIFRGLTQLGYAVFFIGHEKEQTISDGDQSRIIIRPALSASPRAVITGMADIYGYAHQAPGYNSSVLTLRSPDNSISCGGRFKYIKNEFPMSYQNLADAVQEAIEKEAAEHNGQFVTNARESTVETVQYNYKEEMDRFNSLTSALMAKDAENRTTISATVEKYLGKGRKVSETNPNQAEFIFLINSELSEM